MRSLVVALGVVALAGCARGGADNPLDGHPVSRDAPDHRDARDPDSSQHHDAGVDAAIDAPIVPSGHLVINEIDYDMVGTDNAEFVEIYNPTSGAYPLSGLALVLVNGANSAVYATVQLGAAGAMPAGGYLVVGGAGVAVPSSAQKVMTGWNTDAIQNGAPDGVALVDVASMTVLDALSYEGAITAAQITGFAATVSLVEGTMLAASVADSNTVAGSLCRMPDGQDTDDANTDWKFCATSTPGAPNM